MRVRVRVRVRARARGEGEGEREKQRWRGDETDLKKPLGLGVEGEEVRVGARGQDVIVRG